MLHTARTERSITPREAPPRATYKVTFITPDGETDVQVAADEYLLSAAVKAGLDLPFTCLQGWCITCAGRIQEGKANQAEAFRVFPEDEAAGYVLLCSAYPYSDLRIRTHQKMELRALRKAYGLPAPEG